MPTNRRLGYDLIAERNRFARQLVMAVKAWRRPVVTGREDLIGSYGHVADWADREGRIRVRGELWQASAAQTLEPGARVRIAAIDGLALTVLPADEKNEEEDHD